MPAKKVISSLEELPGVDANVLKRLHAIGIYTLKDIIVASLPSLTEAFKSDTAARKAYLEARAALKVDFVDGDKLEPEQHIPCGSEKINKALAGGISTKTSTLMTGGLGSGKTTLCHQLAVNVQLPKERGGLGENSIVVWLDSERTFMPARIKQMAAAVGLDPDKVLHNVKHSYIMDDSQMIVQLEEIDSNIRDKWGEENVRLVVIDSFTGLFRGGQYGTIAGLPPRSVSEGIAFTNINRMLMKYSLAVVLTGQIHGAVKPFARAEDKMTGGTIVQHLPGIHMFLRKLKGEKLRSAEIYDAPGLPPVRVIFKITDEGIRDEEAEGIEKAAKTGGLEPEQEAE